MGVIVVIVTGGKQSQPLALALGLGWSLTKILGVNFFSRGVKKIGGRGNLSQKIFLLKLKF